MRLNLLYISLLAALLSACDSVQNTSGKEYLERNQISESAAKLQTKDSQSFQKKLRDAANIEPTLKFPARIGIARVENQYNRSSLSPIPGDEMVSWSKLGENLGKDFGEFVPVSNFVMQTMQEASSSDSKSENIVQQIRLASARQHLDAVLIYEVNSKDVRNPNMLKAADFTVIGMFIFPSQELKSDALAAATLVDVMSGYPYAQASASFTQEELSTTWNKEDNRDLLRSSSKVGAVENLAKKIEPLVQELIKVRNEKK